MSLLANTALYIGAGAGIHFSIRHLLVVSKRPAGVYALDHLVLPSILLWPLWPISLLIGLIGLCIIMWYWLHRIHKSTTRGKERDK